MKRLVAISLMFSFIVGCASEQASEVYRGEAFLLYSTTGKNLLVLKNPRSTLVVSELPDSFSPTPRSHDRETCVFYASLVSVVAEINLNSGHAHVRKIETIRTAEAREVGYVSPSFSPNLIC